MTAYAADGVVEVGADGMARAQVLHPVVPAVWVECRMTGREPLVRVDHHHPGDPGYTSAPEDYLLGSSLGAASGAWFWVVGLPKRWASQAGGLGIREP